MNTKKAVLVYQAGIANVFQVDCLNLMASGRKEKRLAQNTFGYCEAFCAGLAAADWTVASCHCNKAGDVARMDWDWDLENAPFRESQYPVFHKVAKDVHACFGGEQ